MDAPRGTLMSSWTPGECSGNIRGRSDHPTFKKQTLDGRYWDILVSLNSKSEMAMRKSNVTKRNVRDVITSWPPPPRTTGFDVKTHNERRCNSCGRQRLGQFRKKGTKTSRVEDGIELRTTTTTTPLKKRPNHLSKPASFRDWNLCLEAILYYEAT